MKSSDQSLERRAVMRDELPEIIAESVKRALTEMGIDVADPLAMQQDMQHLREWRKATQQIKREGLLTIIKILIAGSLGLMAIGLYFKHIK